MANKEHVKPVKDVGPNKDTDSIEEIVATPVGSDGSKVERKETKPRDYEVIGGRYIKIKRTKVIITDNTRENAEQFSGNHPMHVTLSGYDGEYLDLKCVRHLKFTGKCGEEVSLDQYQLGGLRESVFQSSRRVKTKDRDVYHDEPISRRRWSIEVVD